MNCKHRLELLNQSEKVACEPIEGVNLTRPSYSCSLHKRCIAAYNPKGKLLTYWNDRPESKMFKLCLHCSDYSLKSHNDNSEKQ